MARLPEGGSGAVGVLLEDLIALGLAIGSLGRPAQVAAHAELVASDPANGATVLFTLAANEVLASATVTTGTSMIVPAPVASVMNALVAFESCTLNDSVASDTRSEVSGTLIVWVVVPGANVNEPSTGV